MAAALILCCACALIEHKVQLIYEPIGQCQVGYENPIYLLPVEEFPPLDRLKGKTVVGVVQNMRGDIKSKITTVDQATDWFANSLIAEFEACGNKLEPVASPPQIGTAIKIQINKILTLNDYCQIDATLEIYKNSRLARQESLKSRGQGDLNLNNMAEIGAMALMRAMQGIVAETTDSITTTQ